jgi:hypothetical protein
MQQEEKCTCITLQCSMERNVLCTRLLVGWQLLLTDICYSTVLMPEQRGKGVSCLIPALSGCPAHLHPCLLQELSEDELVSVLTGPKNALTKQYKQLFSLNKAAFGVTAPALRAIARKAIDKGTGTRSLRSIMEGLLTEAMYHVPEQGPAAHEAGSPVGVLLDEEGVLSGSGGRIVSVQELEQVLAADAAAADGGMSDGGASDGGEPIAAEVR